MDSGGIHHERIENIDYGVDSLSHWRLMKLRISIVQTTMVQPELPAIS